MIIGLTGLKGSGKTTVAKYLELKYNFTEYALADPLKKIAAIFGFTEEELYGTQEDKARINPGLGISAREFLQKFGTEICRDRLPQVLPELKLGQYNIIWIKLMEDFIRKNVVNNDKKLNIVVSDIRFFDESLSLRNFDKSIIIEISRPHRSGRFDVFEMHSSEVSIKDIPYDYQVVNNDTIDNLYKKIDQIIVHHLS